MREENRRLPNTVLCTKLVSTDNFIDAIKSVRRNNGAPGIDGINCDVLKCTDDELKDKVKELFDESRSRIVARTYKSKPVRRVQIPKDNGEMRMLGIPTVQDRVVQQSVVNVIEPMFEKTFSDNSFGYRKGKSAHDALRQVQYYIADGYKYVVSIDLSKFFDKVNHDILMGLIDKTLIDKDIRRLIYVFIKAGAMDNGAQIDSEEGTPQGGVISPLLSNIYLTPFDKEMEKRGIKCVRYCDDITLLAKSEMASKRLKANAIKYLENKLKVKVNMNKTVAQKAYGAKFLGFQFYTYGKKENGFVKELARVKPKKGVIVKFKERIKVITVRSRGRALSVIVQELNWYIRGWLNYYAFGDMKSRLISSLFPWIRRRVRQYMYKLWKKGKARAHQLRLLGVSEEKLRDYKLTSNSYWSMSKNLNNVLVNSILYEKKSKKRTNAINLVNLEEYLNKSLFNFKLSCDIFVTGKRTDRKLWISNNNCYCL